MGESATTDELGGPRSAASESDKAAASEKLKLAQADLVAEQKKHFKDVKDEVCRASSTPLTTLQTTCFSSCWGYLGLGMSSSAADWCLWVGADLGHCGGRGGGGCEGRGQDAAGELGSG